MSLLVLAVLMFLVALGFSILGQGGGILYTPIQVWAGIEFHEAATTSLFLIMVLSLSATLVFRRAKRTDWPLALVLETATTAGGFVGGFWSGAFSGRSLSALFAAVVTLAAYFMVRPFGNATACPSDEARPWFSWRRQLGEEVYCVNLALALPISFAAGLVSGLVGVGGGVLKVPMMVLLFGVPMDIAVGCSAFMVGVTAAGGFVGHVARGHWDWRLSLILAVAVFAGGQVGSRISVNLDKAKLRRGFGVFLFVVAVLMFARAYRM